jgi:hypothetical protein
MPAPPEQALSIRLTGSGRAVLDALWRGAQVEVGGIGWTPVRTRDLAELTRFHRTQVERAVGLVDRAVRPVAGAQVEGWRPGDTAERAAQLLAGGADAGT